MRVYADASGALLSARSEADRKLAGEYPGATAVLDFDEETNPALLQSLKTDWQAHTLIGGQVRKGGVVQTIHPDGPAKQDRDLLPTIIAKLKDGTITAAQQRRVLLYILRELKQPVD